MQGVNGSYFCMYLECLPLCEPQPTISNSFVLDFPHDIHIRGLLLGTPMDTPPAAYNRSKIVSFLLLHNQHIVLQCLGYLCCFQSVILALIQKSKMGHYQPVAEDPTVNLYERHNSPEHAQNQTRHNYKPVVNCPIIASTSRQEPTNHFLDETVQACSSKNSDPFRVA